MSSVPPPLDDDRVWIRLLREVEFRIDTLADEFVTELGRRGLYPPDLVEQQELRATAVESFTAIVRRLMAPDSSGDVVVLASSLGARRAAPGVALDALTEAVRLDLLVLWRQLRVLAGEEHRGLLVDRFDVLLQVLDEYVSETQLSFLRTRAQLELEGRLATTGGTCGRSRSPPNDPDLARVAPERREAQRVRAAIEIEHERPPEISRRWAVVRQPAASPANGGCAYTATDRAQPRAGTSPGRVGRNAACGGLATSQYAVLPITLAGQTAEVLHFGRQSNKRVVRAAVTDRLVGAPDRSPR